MSTIYISISTQIKISILLQIFSFYLLKYFEILNKPIDFSIFNSHMECVATDFCCFFGKAFNMSFKSFSSSVSDPQKKDKPAAKPASTSDEKQGKAPPVKANDDKAPE